MKNSALIILVLLIIMIPCVVCAETYSLQQVVPFGVIDNTKGDQAAIYQKASAKKQIATAVNGTICEIQNSDRIGGTNWYKVRYFDRNKTEIIGYVAGGSLDQMTVADLITAMSDAAIAEYMQSFVGFVMTDTDEREQTNRSQGDTIATLVPTSTPEAGKTYVLNTNTKKFHNPNCSSVKAMKSKNRKDFIGTREELIKKGYQPCKNCNP